MTAAVTKIAEMKIGEKLRANAKETNIKETIVTIAEILARTPNGVTVSTTATVAVTMIAGAIIDVAHALDSF